MIGESIRIKGDVVGEENLIVEGQVEGTIKLPQSNVTIGRKGRVKADVHAKMICIEGEIEGNMHGEDQIILRKASTVRGNILAPRVTLEDGANFKGSIDMSARAEQEVRPARTIPAQPKAAVEDTGKTEKSPAQSTSISAGLKP